MFHLCFCGLDLPQLHPTTESLGTFEYHVFFSKLPKLGSEYVILFLELLFPQTSTKMGTISGLAGADKSLTQNLHPDALSRSFGFNDGEWIYGWTHAVYYVTTSQMRKIVRSSLLIGGGNPGVNGFQWDTPPKFKMAPEK